MQSEDFLVGWTAAETEMEMGMLQHTKAVIFDLDGTLTDSMWMWKEIDIEYLGSKGIALPPGLQEEIEGMCFTETAAYFKDRFLLQESVEEIKAVWNRMAREKYEKEVPLKDGARELLALCAGRGIRMGIATSNSRELVEAVVRAQGIASYFSCILTGCDVGKGKPAPDIYLAAARALQVSPGDCLVFEDIVPGIQAGKAAGMRVCAVEDAYSRTQRTQKEAAADYYITSFREVTAASDSLQ